MDAPDFFDANYEAAPEYDDRGAEPHPLTAGLWGAGELITRVGAIVLALSVFMDWYAGPGVGVTLSVIGWHTGLIGKLVLLLGLATLLVTSLRRLGLQLPPTMPEPLVVIGLGALSTVFILIRVISIPDAVLPANSRGVGLWISLLASLTVIAGGILRAGDEL
jgi:hypothetical protein